MIVMKFGGTSVGSANRIEEVFQIVQPLRAQNPVVVVSAVGGVTDLLIEAGNKALKGLVDIAPIVQRHKAVIDALEQPDRLIQPLHEELYELLTGIRMIKEISPRTSDYLVSFGERISCQIVAAHFNRRGMAARYHFAYDIGMITDNNFQNALPLPEAYDLIRHQLSDTSYVPVVTGFVGKNKKGEITTLGRGGSDYTAAILGAGIGAEEIQIWTDVDGILTTDPRMVPQARNVPVVSFKEAAELAYYGAKVLHPKTIRPAMERGIPVVVKNTGHPAHPGTRIIADPPANGKLVKALSVKKNVTLINVYSLRMLEAVGFLARIFNAFAQHNVAVDMVSTSEVSVSITVEGQPNIDRVVEELSTFARVDVDTNYAIVCIVGEGMRRGVGIAGQIFKVMSDEGIAVEMISQGASDINLGFVIREAQVEKAVKRLHAVLFEG